MLIVSKQKPMRILIILLFISFSSFGQTNEIDELRQIWIDEMFEFDDIIIKDIDWSETFVPYYWDRTFNPSTGYSRYVGKEMQLKTYLEKAGLQTGVYSIKQQAKDATNREITLSNSREAQGRYFVDFDLTSYNIDLTIVDTKDNNKTVGKIYYTKTAAFKNFDKATNKYIRKNELDYRRKLPPIQIILEEVLKRYKK